MNTNMTQQVYERVRFEVTCNEHRIKVVNFNKRLSIQQFEDYTIKKYKFNVLTDGNLYVEVKIKQAGKWLKMDKSFDFDIDKPFTDIQVSFSTDAILPMKYRFEVSYADKKAWDIKAQEIHLSTLRHEVNFSVATGLSFAWILTKKPIWMDHYVVTLFYKDYELCKIESDKNNQMLIDNLPEGELKAVLDAYNTKGLAVTDTRTFNIKSKATDPEHRQVVTNWR